MIIEIRLTDTDVERIATRLAEILRGSDQSIERWLDVAGAATHLGLTENAIRGLVKRQQDPVPPDLERSPPLLRNRTRPLGANWELRTDQ